MKFSIIAVALFAAILGQASPVPVDGSTGVDITAPATQEVASDTVRSESASTLSSQEESVSPLLVVSLRLFVFDTCCHLLISTAFNQSTSVLTDHSERGGGACAAGLKVYGFARITDYTVQGHDVSIRGSSGRYRTTD
jgi:hypothetical protein